MKGKDSGYWKAQTAKNLFVGGCERMRLKICGNKESIVLSLAGRLDGSTAWQIKRALDNLVESSTGHRLQVDFQRVRQWEHFGAAILAKNLKSMAARFREISLIGMDDALAKIFRSVGVTANVAALR